MIIELTGPVGAGKTTIAKLLQHCLQKKDVPVLFATSETELSILRRLGWRIPLGVVNRWYGILFLLEHSSIAWTVLSTQWDRPIPWKQRIWILRWFLTHVGRYHFLSRHLAPSETVIFQEGLLHRAVSLFSSDKEPPCADIIARYVKNLPRSDLLIEVRASPALCVERIRKRGILRRRLQGLGRDAKLQFVRHQAEAIAQLIDEARRYGWSLITIDNTESLEYVQEQLQTRFSWVNSDDFQAQAAVLIAES